MDGCPPTGKVVLEGEEAQDSERREEGEGPDNGEGVYGGSEWGTDSPLSSLESEGEDRDTDEWVSKGQGGRVQYFSALDAGG